MTPVTLQVHMDGIDQEALAEYINRNDSPRFLTEIERLRAKGEWPFIYERFITVQMTEPGTMIVNTPRITGIDGTDGASVTRGMIQGRREILQLILDPLRGMPQTVIGNGASAAGRSANRWAAAAPPCSSPRVDSRYRSIPADFRFAADGINDVVASFRSAVNEAVPLPVS